MIGQKRILTRIDNLSRASFPRFCILAGAAGGRKLVAAHIAKKLNAHYVSVGVKVDEVREAIALAYKQSTPVLYVIAGAEKMSIAAKNAMLKVTEEPPRQAYFLMILEDAASTLATLRSRGTVLSMDNYYAEELLEYATSMEYALSAAEIRVLCDVCATPKDVNKLVAYNIQEFYEFAEKVVLNIGSVSGANALKIPMSLSFKEDDGKWSPELFLRVIMALCREQVEQNPRLYFELCKTTSKYLAELAITGVSRAATVDAWVFDMRSAWRDHHE